MPYEPNKENLTQNNSAKSVFHYCNENGEPIFKTKEIHADGKIIFFPFTVNRSLGQAKPKRIKTIEFRGWKSVDNLPKIIRRTPGYGFKFESSTQLLNVIYKKFPKVEKITIVLNGKSQFSEKSITISWSDFAEFVRRLKKEKLNYTENRKHLVYDILSDRTSKISKLNRSLKSGELQDFLSLFNSFEKISAKDIDALAGILSDLPVTRISTTAHIIRTKEKIDIIYLEDILEQFQSLLKNASSNEEKWQQFFQKHTWTLSHLFPYEVILHKDKAYVGGKTLQNDEGRIVDFLFETGFKDNFALLEIKTPDTPLLRTSAYREPSVFALSNELSGAINQCLDQKDTFLRDQGQKQKSLDPKLILVAGQKKKLSTPQNDCFELARANQKNVDIVTFDELDAKLTGLYQVITGKRKKI